MARTDCCGRARRWICSPAIPARLEQLEAVQEAGLSELRGLRERLDSAFREAAKSRAGIEARLARIETSLEQLRALRKSTDAAAHRLTLAERSLLGVS